jgi:hypothetical protein
MNWIKVTTVLLVLGGLAIAGQSEAFEFLWGKWHDPALPMVYRLNTFHNEATVPGNEEFDDVRQSFLNWEVVAGSRLAFTEGPPVTTQFPCSHTVDLLNVLAFRDCLNQCSGSCIGQTSSTYDLGADYDQIGQAHLRRIDSDIIFGRQWSWITLPTAQQQGCSGRMIVQSIATHEIGHQIGLGHSAIFGSTMFPSTTFCDQGPASLHVDDIIGTVQMYDETLQEYQIATHDVNQVRMGVDNAGNVGLPGGAPGPPVGVTGLGGGTGFKFPAGSVNHLFEGSFLFAREAVGDTNVSDDYRIQGPAGSVSQDADFVPLSDLTILTPGILTDQESFCQFDDSAANRTGVGNPQLQTAPTQPLGIRVRQETYACASAPDDKYVIIVYRLTNTTGATISGLNAGMILDWDFTGNFSSNGVSYDAANRLGIVSDPSTLNRVGVRVLNPEGTRSFRALVSSGAGVDLYYNTTKAQWLKSGFTQTSLSNRDIGMLICTGSFDIAPGGTAVAAFAMCAGVNVTDLQTVSQAAQLKYDTVISQTTAVTETAGVVGPVYKLKQNVPNPFNPSTRISYVVPEAADVSLKVYNLTGKLVRTLLDGPGAAGPAEVTWDGRDETGQAVASGTYFYELRADGRLVQSRKMQLLK